MKVKMTEMVVASETFNQTTTGFDPTSRRVGAGEARISLRHDQEIVKLFYIIDALKPAGKNVVLQFVAALPGEGTTTISSNFAAVAASEGRQGVLLVDCNAQPFEVRLKNTSGVTLIEAYRQGIPLESAYRQAEGHENLRTAKLSNRANPLVEIDRDDLIQLVALLRQSFSMTIFDCAAATKAPDSVALSRYCDGSILVVRAEYSRPAVIRSVQKSIDLVGGEIIGVAFNRRKTYIPEWLYARLFAGSKAGSRGQRS